MHDIRRTLALGELVRSKMVSGNEIPVSRCTITSAEISAIDSAEKYQEKESIVTPDTMEALYIASLEISLASCKARIDELMLEYCPEEMSREQLQEYEKHQRCVEEGI